MSTNQINGPEVIIATRSGQAAAADDASSEAQPRFVMVEQEMDETAVVPLLRGATQQQVFEGYGYTYRHNWGLRRGEMVLRLTSPRTPLITPRSRIFVAIGEGMGPGPDAGKYIGSARYTVHNIAPRANGVDIWVNIEHWADIRLYADYFVVTPPAYAVSEDA